MTSPSTSTEEQESLSFTEDELEDFPTRDSDPSGPGMTAQVTLSGSDHPGDRCGLGVGDYQICASLDEAGLTLTRANDSESVLSV
jgi:hypothetical protein